MRSSKEQQPHKSASPSGAAKWFETAASGVVVRRGLGYAIGVGAILIAINHGDAILAGQVDATRVLKMALTVLVPYCVSTASSVGAILSTPPCADTSTSAANGEAGRS